MKRIGPYIRHELTRAPDTATYEQCQQIYALMKACNMTPEWVEGLPYSKAVELITTLKQIAELTRHE